MSLCVKAYAVCQINVLQLTSGRLVHTLMHALFLVSLFFASLSLFAASLFDILTTKPKLEKLKMDVSFLNRNVNEGFSGGERKRNEILQLACLEADLAILDEIDSGLDVDALRDVANAVNGLRTKENGILLITHYNRLLEYIKPDFVHIMRDGKIVQTGGQELAVRLEKEGFEALA